MLHFDSYTLEERAFESFNILGRHKVAFLDVLTKQIFEVDECWLADGDIEGTVVADYKQFDSESVRWSYLGERLVAGVGGRGVESAR